MTQLWNSSCGHKLSELSDVEFIEQVIIGFDAIPLELRNNPALMNQFLPIIRADFLLVESYDYSVSLYISCKISYMFGKDDPNVIAQDSFESLGNVKFFEGGHLYINEHKEEVIEWILEEIKSGLTVPSRFDVATLNHIITHKS